MGWKREHSCCWYRTYIWRAGEQKSSWVVSGTFIAAAALHSDAERSGGGTLLREKPPRISPLIASLYFSLRYAPPHSPTPSRRTLRGFFLNVIYSVGVSGKRSPGLHTERIAAVSASWVIGAQQQQQQHRMKCVTTNQLPHLQASAPRARTVPRADRFTRWGDPSFFEKKKNWILSVKGV